MALRKRGKQGFWHAYFRTVTARADGQLQYKLTTVNLGTADLLQAKAMERELMAKKPEGPAPPAVPRRHDRPGAGCGRRYSGSHSRRARSRLACIDALFGRLLVAP